MTSRAGQALIAAISEIGDGLSPEAWDVLADPDAAVAAIEQEVRDDIRARGLVLRDEFDRWMTTEGSADFRENIDRFLAAISSSSAPGGAE